jgi:hypothetical protein
MSFINYTLSTRIDDLAFSKEAMSDENGLRSEFELGNVTVFCVLI